METLTAAQIAAAIGAPTKDLNGTQDWQSALHPELVVSEIHYTNGGGCLPFRVKNTVTGEVFSKLPSEKAPGDVDGLYAEMLGHCQTVEQQLKPAIYAAIPDLAPDADVVRLNKGGREILCDLVDGKLVNERDAPEHPCFVVKRGKVEVDVSALSDAHKAAFRDGIEALALGDLTAIKG